MSKSQLKTTLTISGLPLTRTLHYRPPCTQRLARHCFAGCLLITLCTGSLHAFSTLIEQIELQTGVGRMMSIFTISLSGIIK